MSTSKSESKEKENQEECHKAIELQLDPQLLEILICPKTKTSLSYDSKTQELISKKAKLAYPIRHGIPIMIEEEARIL